MKNFRWIALVGIMMLGMLARARANTVVLFNSTTGGPSTFLWSYEAVLSVGEETQELSAAPNFPTFFTIYDIGGLVSGSEIQPAGWSFSEQLVGITPPGVSPTDNPTVVNITWTYTAANAQIIPTATDIDLGAFKFTSTMGNNGLIISYSQQATKNNPGQPDDDTRDVGLGSVVGPSGSVSTIPEPSTLLLLCTGLLGVVGITRKKLAHWRES